MSPENLSRRAILAGAAAVPALALPIVVAAIPAAADDTFARIVRHRAIAIQLEAICHRMGKLEEEIPNERCKHYGIWDRGTDVGKEDDPRWTALQAEYWVADDEKDAIAWSFVDRPPSSVAAAAALLAYADEHEKQGWEWPDSRHNFSETGRHLGCTEEDWRSSVSTALATVLATMAVQS
jgi:hypothetical protein